MLANAKCENVEREYEHLIPEKNAAFLNINKAACKLRLTSKSYSELCIVYFENFESFF